MKKTQRNTSTQQRNVTCRFKMSVGCFLLLSLLIFTACANPGKGPDGGPYDETPPKIMAMNPMLGQKNVQPKKVTIFFDEIVKLENASEKIIVSPPQIEMPEIKALGRKISVGLIDTLKKNTTYTIDFSDAIEDNNEGNPMGQFTYFFSTGEQVDTMEVSGNVLSAENLEPIKGILVGLHSDTTDSAFTTKPFERVARTNGDGRFTIKGVAPGSYRIYALKDMDGDFKMSRGEMIAFSEDLIVPSSHPDLRYDTLWTDTIRYDTIIPVGYTHYLPDDVVLRSFQEIRTDRQLLKTKRDVPEWFQVFFTAASTHVPTIKGLNFDETDAFLEERTPSNDTITYWLRDFDHFPSVDTLQFAYTYEAFDDSTELNVLKTDTFELIPRNTLARRLKQKEKDLEKWEKRREKRHKKGDFSEETPPVERLTMNRVKAGRISPQENVHLSFPEPLARLDTAGFHLIRIKDSLRIDAPYLIERDEYKLTEYTVRGEWRPGQSYELVIDSAAIEGISGKIMLSTTERISIPKNEDYGALFLNIPDADSTAIVQILSGDKVSRQLPVTDHRADFFYLNPGKIYLRLFYDRNGNGKWDTGSYAEHRQPEEVFYFPTALEVRANWDIEQNWNLHELPVTQQKPKELIKQKESKKTHDPHRKNLERERERAKM